MTDEATQRPGLSVEDVSRAALDLADARELPSLVDRFLACVREWAAPSAVLAAVRDDQAESGWRLLSALSAGSGPLGADRSLPQLVAEAPECLERPSLIQPKGDAPGVRARDNCVVPWRCEGASGILVLRGVPRPSPPNLPQALALLSAPVWPRLIGSPADRIENGVAELRRIAERFQEDTARQLERLQAARVSEPPAAETSTAEAAPEPAELQRLEDQRRAAEAAATTAREELQQARAERDEAQQAREAARQARDEARRERDDALRGLDGATRELDEARHARGDAQRGLDEARQAGEAARRERDEALQARDDARRELEEALRGRDAASGELDEARQGRDSARRELDEARQAQEADRRVQDEARQRAQKTADELDQIKRSVGDLVKAAQEAEMERDRARAEVAQLSARVESLQHELKAAGAAERQPASAGDVSDAVAATPPDRALQALRSALGVARRTPFVPPALRIAMEEAEALVSGRSEQSAPRLRVVLLDRDAVSLEPLAADLEAAGLDVRIANYPEELALLLKTPDARALNAAVCDVLAFRPDQNVAGLFRAWEKDRPGLALYLSFGADNPAETERAQRVPLALTAGRFQRPLRREELIEMLEPLARRQATG